MNKLPMEQKKALEAFRTYVKRYDSSDKRNAMKETHSIAVASLCLEIARALSLSQEDTETVWLAGLLHDFGHFEQLRCFGTFFDDRSVDHALLGADLLFREGLIRRFRKDDSRDNLIGEIIRAHNRFRLPGKQDDTTRTLCRIVRDADKIDILRIGSEEPASIVYEEPEKEVFSSKVSPEVVRVFLTRNVVDHALKKTPADYMAGDASLAFGLFFRESRQILRAHGYHQSVFSHPMTDPDTLDAFAKMEAELIAYLR